MRYARDELGEIGGRVDLNSPRACSRDTRRAAAHGGKWRRVSKNESSVRERPRLRYAYRTRCPAILGADRKLLVFHRDGNSPKVLDHVRREGKGEGHILAGDGRQ